jgi:phasin family protein
MATVKTSMPKTKMDFDPAGLTEKVAEAGKQNMEAYAASFSAAQAGAEKLTARAVAFTKAAAESQAEAAKALMASKSAQEFFEKQATFTKSFFETYVAEMKAFQGLVAGVAQDVAKPLNERVAAYREFMPNVAA